jgi:predicted AlkP superfamily pyrophosphatase or phosphodiesterase
MFARSALAALLAWLLVAAAVATADVAPPAEPTVIVLSWDGTRWDYPERTPLPALERLAREGVRAQALVPVFPASTFPNHVSLATGAWVEGHGIVGNAFDDPERGRYSYSADADYIMAEPIWVAAERQGVRAASFFWVGSETPWRGRAATYRRTPFDAKVGEAEKVDQIFAWLDLPAAERPRLILSWWHGADSFGHDNGPDAQGIATELAGQDAQLARLLAGLDERKLWPSTTLFVVSDHGMALAGKAVDVLGPLTAAGIAAKLEGGGGSGYVTLEDPAELAAALQVLKDVEGLSAYASTALPAELHARYPTRTGHITVILEPPRAIFQPRSFTEAALLRLARLLDHGLGTHGYDPKHRDMHAIFYAAGRGVPPDLALTRVDAIDVAPTIAHLLGIEPPANAVGVRIPGIGERSDAMERHDPAPADH